MLEQTLAAAGRWCKRESGETDIEYLRRSLEYLPHGIRYDGPFYLLPKASADHELVRGYLKLYDSEHHE